MDTKSVVRTFLLAAIAGAAAALLPFAAHAAQLEEAREHARRLIDVGRPEDSVLACSLCHGEGGGGDVNFAFGNLTGQSAEYLAKQLRAFQSGERDHRVMRRISNGLTDKDIEVLAAYYANLKVARRVSGQVKPPEVGVRLALDGDPERGLPACQSCHGQDAEATGLTIANINGQHSSYLVNQLVAWQMGKRGDDSVMADIAPKLTVPEIQALAIYYSQQQRREKGERE